MKALEGGLWLRFRDRLHSSRATIRPRIVVARAVYFRYCGIVVWGMVVGGMLLYSRNPAKMLPSIRRLIGFVSEGLFSLMLIRVLDRGCPNSVKKMIRVL